MNDYIDQSISFDNQCDSEERPYKCSQCDKSFSDSCNLLNHMKTHTRESPYECNQCDKAFTRNFDLKRHMKIHNGEKPYQCSQCDKTFSENRYLIKHLLIHTVENSYICSLCDNSFSTKSSLTSHMRFHTGERPYQCSMCDKYFQRNSNLLRHMFIHTGEKTHVCSQCAKAFSHNHNLVRHMKIHQGERAYQCSQCKKTFPQNTQLKKHMMVHSREHSSTNKTICTNSGCEETFYHHNDLIEHLRSHNGERPYQCNQCDKAFSKNYDLKRHIKIHTGEKPYQCSQCDKTFLENRYLTKHMLVHTSEKTHECSKCTKAFSSLANLVRHMRMHTGEKPYQCSQCNKTFSQHNQHKRHMMVHSGDHSSKNKTTKCTNSDCEETFYHHSDLIEHLKLRHDADLQVSQHIFISMNDFLTWKEAEETKNFIYYSKNGAAKKGKSISYMYYLCQKGGSSRHHYRKGEAYRKSSRRNKKGVVKTDIFCPSRITCKVDNLTGAITVTYTQTHNHQNQFQDTQHHPIPRSIVEKVKLRLISDSSAKEIFKDLKKENTCANKEDSANNIPQKQISIRSIKKIAEKLKSKKDIEYQNQETPQEGSSRHETGISNLAVDLLKVNENSWNIKSYTSHKKEDANIHVIEFVRPFCGTNSCSDKIDDLFCIGLCSHMYQCSCQEKSNICSHIHKVHSSRNQNFQAPNITTSEVVVSNDTDSNNDEPIKNIANNSEEYYVENNSDIDSETALRTTTLKTMEDIHNHLNDDKYRSLYLKRISTVLEQLNSEIKAIKCNGKTIQNKLVDKIFTEL